jgi:glutamate--cysteine ligase
MERPSDTTPIGSVDELVAHFAKGVKPADKLHVGMEHEKIGVLADGRAPGYDVIGPLLERLAARGWNRIE